MKTAASRSYPWFSSFLKSTVGTFLKFRFRLRAENLDELKRIPGPWLVLPNHVMSWDPVFVALYIRKPIHFIASDANFRNRFSAFWLRVLGTIPISKKAADFSSLRQIVGTLKAGISVGLFPEGERCWDGVTMPMIPSTAKLARLAGVPVIVPVLKGAYQSKPRWVYSSRRGPVTIEYRVAVGPEEVGKLSLEEITSRIEKALYHDDHAYQKEQNIAYRGKAPAELLEHVLFACPSCESLGSIRAAGDEVRCTSCGETHRFTPMGIFTNKEGNPSSIENIRQWNLKQQDILSRKIQEIRDAADNAAPPLFSDNGARHSTGFKFESLTHRGEGTLFADKVGLHFTGARGTRDYPWESMRGLHVVYQNQLEFYDGKELQVFTFGKHPVSGYKYLCAGRIFQGDTGTIE